MKRNSISIFAHSDIALEILTWINSLSKLYPNKELKRLKKEKQNLLKQ